MTNTYYLLSQADLELIHTALETGRQHTATVGWEFNTPTEDDDIEAAIALIEKLKQGSEGLDK